jgi:hypothetical protein
LLCAITASDWLNPVTSVKTNKATVVYKPAVATTGNIDKTVMRKITDLEFALGPVRIIIDRRFWLVCTTSRIANHILLLADCHDNYR